MIVVYGVFDSTDAAEFAATRIKRTLLGVRVSGIARRVMRDRSEETTLYVYPAYNSLNAGMNSGGVLPTLPFLALPVSEDDGEHSETREREDVRLRVEAEDESAARAVSAVMRSMGGREIHEAAR